jgi:hypothetical protein
MDLKVRMFLVKSNLAAAKRRLPPVLFNLQVPNASRGAKSDRQSPDTFDQKPKK